MTLDAGLAQIAIGRAWWLRRYAAEQSPEDREVTDGTTESRASDFYVTSTDQGVITGFFVEGTLVYVVRFSPRAKVFSFFDSFRERLIAGSCT